LRFDIVWEVSDLFKLRSAEIIDFRSWDLSQVPEDHWLDVS
jgi:hypothetical protein